MTSYAGDIDLTENVFGQKYSCVAGSGGVTAGYPVKFDGTTANVVVATTATSSLAIGIARETAAEGAAVAVLGEGCLVKVPYTLTINTKVGLSTGDLCDYSTGTCMGITVKSATLASWVRVKIQW